MSAPGRSSVAGASLLKRAYTSGDSRRVSGYSIDALPPGFRVRHLVDASTSPRQVRHIVQTDGATSFPLDPTSETYQPDLDAFVTSQLATSETANVAAAKIVTETLQSARVTPGGLQSSFEGLLGQARAAIPFFEGYALDPSMTSQQWEDFVSLPQSPPPGTPEAVSKDRLLYDVVRSMAALMRYLTGDLPAA